MTIREGKWQCPGCKTILRGSVVQCEGCGHTRDASTKFFFDEKDAPVVTEEAELKKAKAGADWVCTFCDNSNPQASQTCQGCNAPRSEKLHKAGDITPVGGVAAVAPPAPTDAAAPAQGGGKGLMGVLAIFALLLVCCCGGVFFMNRSHEDVGTVASVAWERSIEVEAVKPVQDTAWDQAPPGARDVTHRREVRDHKQVQRGTKTVYVKEKVQVGSHKEVVGHKDLGNGRFEDVEKDVPDYAMKDVAHEEPVYVDEPVYGEHYFFTIDKWVTTRTPQAHGTTEPPAWPATDLSKRQGEREGKRAESYTVTFDVKSAGRTFETHPANEAEFVRYKPGSSWQVKWTRGGELTVVAPAAAAAGSK